MNYFFDSNIIIGYSICLDSWHRSSRNIFKQKNKYYWSKNVREESLKLLIRLISNYELFIAKIIDRIDKGTITKKNFFNLVENIELDVYKKDKINKSKIAKEIWSFGKWKNKVHYKKLIRILNVLIQKLNSTSSKYFNQCLEQLILHERKESYENILKSFHRLKTVNSNRIHYPDDEILLDAHDLANTGIDVEFITSDKKLLEFKKDIIVLTNINKMTFIDDIN